MRLVRAGILRSKPKNQGFAGDYAHESAGAGLLRVSRAKACAAVGFQTFSKLCGACLLAEQRFDALVSCRNLAFDAENQGFPVITPMNPPAQACCASAEPKLALLLGSRLSASYVEHVC